DYWDAVDLWVHPGWRAFREAMSRDRCLYFSARATRPLSEAQFRANSVLVFGNETDGMPDRILEKHPDECFTIPMQSGKVRSLNLATAAGIVLYEGLRQVGAKDAAKLASAFVAEKPEGDAPAEPKARAAGGSPRPRRRRRG
ncbi:MAG TPA: TrmH family RNA methyltransferase, partial [Gemmatimonadales bacterium]|nr:TrmH family RNA methyltransferase [Gemmatimonadales bacterium]